MYYPSPGGVAICNSNALIHPAPCAQQAAHAGPVGELAKDKDKVVRRRAVTAISRLDDCGKALPLPCGFTAFVAKTLHCLSD